MTCARLYKHLFVRGTTEGYQVRPCCISTGDKEYVQHITELQNHKVLQDTRLAFSKGEFPNICIRCKQKEDENKASSRIHYNEKYGTSFNLDENGNTDEIIVDWDIRPSNTCNLKCIMCNPGWSSKWAEDLEIAEKYGNYQPKIDKNYFDWEWLERSTIGKAQKISFLGGEPFYMKEVTQFLEKLSQNEYNIENTRLRFNTNGVSFNDKIWNLISKFKQDLDITFSCEGIGEINELIRFPSKWNEFENNFFKCVENKKIIQSVNITVGAYNYPVLEQTKEYFKKYTDFLDITYIQDPDFLTVDALRDPYKKEKMQNYFLDLDKKRGTNSKLVIPWIYDEIL